MDKKKCPWKSKRRFLRDRKVKGEVSTVQYDTMEGKKRFLVDGIIRKTPTAPNVIMAMLKIP